MNVGTRVKRNPAHFDPKRYPANHPALARRGTIAARQGTGFVVEWDDGERMPYLRQEIVPAK